MPDEAVGQATAGRDWTVATSRRECGASPDQVLGVRALVLKTASAQLDAAPADPDRACAAAAAAFLKLSRSRGVEPTANAWKIWDREFGCAEAATAGKEGESTLDRLSPDAVASVDSMEAQIAAATSVDAVSAPYGRRMMEGQLAQPPIRLRPLMSVRMSFRGAMRRKPMPHRICPNASEGSMSPA